MTQLVYCPNFVEAFSRALSSVLFHDDFQDGVIEAGGRSFKVNIGAISSISLKAREMFSSKPIMKIDMDPKIVEAVITDLHIGRKQDLSGGYDKCLEFFELEERPSHYKGYFELMLQNLRFLASYSDVFIRGEDNRQVGFNSFLLAEHSPWFHAFLLRKPRNILGYRLRMKNVSKEDLENFKDFLYFGKCRIAADTLSQFVNKFEIFRQQKLEQIRVELELTEIAKNLFSCPMKTFYKFEKDWNRKHYLEMLEMDQPRIPKRRRI